MTERERWRIIRVWDDVEKEFVDVVVYGSCAKIYKEQIEGITVDVRDLTMKDYENTAPYVLDMFRELEKVGKES